MGELATRFRDSDSFAAASLIGDYAQIRALSPSTSVLRDDVIEGIIGIMTPRAVLEKTVHEKEIISTEKYPSFDLLRRDRELVRDLRLVPARGPQVQAEYEQMPRDTFLEIVRGHYVNCPSGMTLVREMFPSELPRGVGQYVVWLGRDDILDYRVAEFIGTIMDISGLALDDIILFERSRNTSTQFVKVAVPEFRHIHMWTRRELQWEREEVVK